MQVLMVAEKPSLAQSIAHILSDGKVYFLNLKNPSFPSHHTVKEFHQCVTFMNMNQNYLETLPNSK